MTTLPRYGMAVAPKDTGGTYSVVHLCTGKKQTSGWDHHNAAELAVENNYFQPQDARAGRRPLCSNGLACLGWVAWKEPVTGGFEP